VGAWRCGANGLIVAHRTFRDTAGVEWQVWDVHPQWVDRRTSERRSASSGAPLAGERRRTADRRHSSTVRDVRARVTQGFEHGWLTFDARHERRRLAPIPASWESASEEELAAFCEAAKVVEARRGRLIE
jgi:hypothetical protein